MDRANNRILRWSSSSALANGSDAEAVLGQADFTTGTSGLSAAKFNSPIGVHVDAGGRLWVGDFSNNRVLRFDNAASKPSGANADGVLGQPNFTTSTAAITQTGMNGPVGIHTDGAGRLWVSNFGNHRVLRFDSAATKLNGANADGVLGQLDFTTGTSGLAQNKLNNPNSVYVDEGGGLWVSDFTNRRVVRYDSAAAKPNGANANGVLGQPNFTTNTATLSRNGFSTTRFVAGDPMGRIYVVEETNNRIMIFNAAATLPNGANADYVLGQADFTTNAAPNPPSASSVATPRAAVVDLLSGRLWVADWANNRVVRFDRTRQGTTDVSESAPGIPTGFSLSQNYPNPFNPTTTSKYQLPTASRVTLKVFDVLGREVRTLVDEVQGSGFMTVRFDAASLASGVYFYRIEAKAVDGSNAFQLVRRLMVVK